MNKRKVPEVVGKKVPIAKNYSSKYQNHMMPGKYTSCQKSRKNVNNINNNPTLLQRQAVIKKPLSSHSRSQAQPIPSISKDYDDLRKRLQELKDLMKSIREKYNKAEKQLTLEHQCELNKLEKQQKNKMTEMDGKYGTTSKQEAIKTQIETMKRNAEKLLNDGKQEEYQNMIKQIRNIESQMIVSDKYSRMREIEARKEPMVRAYQIKIHQTKAKQESEIHKLYRERDEELAPIQAEYNELDKKLHGDASRVARSILCRKDHCY